MKFEIMKCDRQGFIVALVNIDFCRGKFFNDCDFRNVVKRKAIYAKDSEFRIFFDHWDYSSVYFLLLNVFFHAITIFILCQNIRINIHVEFCIFVVNFFSKNKKYNQMIIDNLNNVEL